MGLACRELLQRGLEADIKGVLLALDSGHWCLGALFEGGSKNAK